MRHLTGGVFRRLGMEIAGFQLKSLKTRMSRRDLPKSHAICRDYQRHWAFYGFTRITNALK
jgi:hypothetical protein